MNIKNIKNYFESHFESKNVLRKTLWFIGILIIALLFFKAGEFVGVKKASFSYQFGERYFKTFAGPKNNFPNDLGDRYFLMGHGTFGTIVNISTSTIIVQDRGGIEKIITVTPKTTVMKFKNTISISDLSVDDNIIVIGSPDNSGEINAKLIRIVPFSTSTELLPPPPQMQQMVPMRDMFR